MHRRNFIKSGGALALTQIIGMSGLSSLAALANTLPPSKRMPLMFVGHGSPMNAITNNSFHRKWQEIGKSLPKPKAILSISAHWTTTGTAVATTVQPETIHDFGGFPKQLFEQQYPAQGSPEMALLTQQLLHASHVQTDAKWGLDHGTWSVLLPMFPLADIPVYQLSIYYDKAPEYHYELGSQLATLRDKGVLIMGSGNLVHNLYKVDWNNTGATYDWANEFDTKFKEWIEKGDHKSAMDYKRILGSTADMAHPTNDHLLPLYYILGAQQKNEEIHFFNDSFDMGSISMRSFLVTA
jgi:4,5-DOPA dioxygenase extradiol